MAKKKKALGIDLFTENQLARLEACRQLILVLQNCLEKLPKEYGIKHAADISYAADYLSRREVQILSEMASVVSDLARNDSSDPVKMMHGIRLARFMLSTLGIAHMSWLRFIVISLSKPHDTFLTLYSVSGSYGSHQRVMVKLMDKLIKALAGLDKDVDLAISKDMLSQTDQLIENNFRPACDADDEGRDLQVAEAMERWREMMVSSNALSIQEATKPTEALLIAATPLFSLAKLLVKAFRTLPKEDLSKGIRRALEGLTC